MSFASPPLLLALLVLPPLLALALWLERRRARYAVAFTNLDLLATVVAEKRPWRRWIPLALFLLALAAAAAALARPRANVPVRVVQATVVLLVDVSGSMRADDVKPSRLGAAQAAMNAFLDKVPKNFKVGLVSFSTEPSVLVTPTTDRELMREGIDLLAPQAKTAIGDGLAAAARVAKSSLGRARPGPRRRLPAVIILLSDGAQTSGVLQPLEGAARARQANIPVDTIALGTPNGRLNFGGGGGGFGGSGAFGRFMRPDPATMRAIAKATGGMTFTAKNASRVAAIYKQLSSSIAPVHKSREISSWFAGAAALLLLGSVGAGRLTAGRLP